MAVFTAQNATHNSGDSLHFRDVVVGEIAVAGGVQELGVAEQPPEFGGDRGVFSLDDLRAHIEAFPNQSPVSQHTHSVEIISNLKGSYDAISSFSFSLECYKLIVHR